MLQAAEHSVPRPIPYESDPPPFRSAHDALKFAITRAGRYPRPSLSRMLDTSSAGGMFGGYDGDAQAGMVMQAVRPMGKLAIAVLAVKVASVTTSCLCKRACCSGRQVNPLWGESVHVIADAAPVPCAVNVRDALVMKIYSNRTTLQRISEEYYLEIDTVAKYHRSMLKWLQGVRGKEIPIPGVDSQAWIDAEALLRDAGLVGGSVAE